SVCMNLLPAAGVAWLAAQLTQEFEAKQPSLADQIPGYGGGYGPKPGPSHTGNDKTTNPIPGGTSTTYPAEGPKEVGTSGKPLDPQKPEDSILPGSPAEPLPGIGLVYKDAENASVKEKGFTPAIRTGLDFDTKIKEQPGGRVEVELSARQKFDKTGSVIDSKFAQSDLLGNYSSDNGNLHVDWYGTTVSGKNVGSEMISRAIEAVGSDKVKTVSARLGYDNLDAFNAGVSEGLSKEQSVWKTPIGKTMSSLGFKNVKIEGSIFKFF
ncbi:hypothetical protein DFO48_101910, partial [Comamonas sp. AG1104]